MAECNGCVRQLREFGNSIITKEGLADFLKSHNVLLREKECPRCGNAKCYLRPDGTYFCGKTLVACGKKSRCQFAESFRRNTWFAGSQLSVDTITMFTVYWAVIRPPRTSFLLEQLGISKQAVTDWSKYCRQLCVAWCEQTKEMIGGVGVIVEIDEAILGKRKNRAGKIVKGQWILGGYERDTKKLFVVVVPNRTKETLLAVIKEWVLPGTTIYSDCWKSYQCLSHEGFKHSTVNHSHTFYNRCIDAHTQGVERQWREVRAAVPKYGRREAQTYSYLCEYLWKRTLPLSTERIHAVFKDLVSKQYDPRNPDSEMAVAARDSIDEDDGSDGDDGGEGASAPM